MVRVLVIVLVAVTMGVASAAAVASPPSVTLNGSASCCSSPDGAGAAVIVPDATLTVGKAPTGSLETGGRFNNTLYTFKGFVTCMLVQANRVIVGAFGVAGYEEPDSPHETFTRLPGTYMQVAVVEHGIFADTEAPEKFLPHRYGMLGSHNEGIPSEVFPECAEYSELEANWTGNGGDHLLLSPSITRPAEGHVFRSGTARLTGSGEPETLVTVYPVGHASEGKIVKVNRKGRWSTKLPGLAPGTYEYTAAAVGGSTILANTVRFSIP
jgi:hypothetical protein